VVDPLQLVNPASQSAGRLSASRHMLQAFSGEISNVMMDRSRVVGSSVSSDSMSVEILLCLVIPTLPSLVLSIRFSK
jgi:hypothetical protein